jgi:folate-binding protein YgfZ
VNRPLLNPLHSAAGAALGGGDPPVLLTYGDVPAEYAAAQSGCVVLDQTMRGLLRVRGEEAAAFLHRLLANRVVDLAPGEGNRNLLLSSKGKVQHDFDLAMTPDGIDLSTPPGTVAGLASALDIYHFAEKVTFEDATQRHAPLALAGPRTPEVLRAVVGLELPTADHAHVRGTFEGAPVHVTALPIAGSVGARLDAGPEHAQALWEAAVAAGAQPAGLVVYDILRVEAGAAEPGVDVDDNVYPQEARLEAAFSLDKGCYIGQEVVAKIDTYGGLNKRITGLQVSHDDPVPRGTTLWRQEGEEWRELGLVTSWAYSFVLDTGLVLGYVKRRHQEPGTVFRLGDGPATATVVELPVRAGVAAAPGAAS